MVGHRYVTTPAKATHVPRLGADSKDQVCRYIASKSGDMTKETQSSFTDDVWDVEEAGMAQNFIFGHKVMPADVHGESGTLI